MGLFDFMKKRQPANEVAQPSQSLPETAEHESAKEPNAVQPHASSSLSPSGMGIDLIYDYLNRDFETLAYNDALSSPDIAYKEKAKTIIRCRLQVLIDQVKVKYQDDLREIDFHIDSRSKAGLVDVVYKLRTNKDKLTDHHNKLLEIERGLKDESSYIMGMMLAYEKGFMRGLAALSMDKLNRL